LRLGDLNGPFEDQEQHPARAAVFHERLSGRDATCGGVALQHLTILVWE
jgi:hypothetical protein